VFGITEGRTEEEDKEKDGQTTSRNGVYVNYDLLSQQDGEKQD